MLFHNAVAVLHLFAEGQPGHQSHLVAVGGDVVVGLNEVLGQSLFEEHQFVDAAGQHIAVPGASEHHIAAQSAQCVGGEGVHQVAVDVDGGVVLRAVDGQHVVVPSAIGKGAVGLLHQVAIVETQVAVLEGYQCAVETVNALIAALAPAGREERCVLLGGAEPEHKGVVLNCGAREDVLVEADGLCAVEVQGIAGGVGPGKTLEGQRGAAGIVGAGVAASFVHRVVCRQLLFVARQVLLVGLNYFGLVQGLDPYTCLKHIAAIAVSEDQRCGLRAEG